MSAYPREIGRAKLYSTDRMEFVTQGEDEGGRVCWRTYSALTTPKGEIIFRFDFTAYSPPNDWHELPVPGTD